MLVYNLGNIEPGNQTFITVTVRVKDAARAGSNLIFTVILEYNNGQSLSAYLTVQVGEPRNAAGPDIGGALAGLIADLGDSWYLLVWLALGTFIIWLIAFIAYKKYWKNGNGNGNGNGYSNQGAYRPPPTANQ